MSRVGLVVAVTYVLASYVLFCFGGVKITPGLTRLVVCNTLPNGCALWSSFITIGLPVASVAYQVILEPGICQFREFEPRRVHTRINSLGLFLVLKLTCGKRESVS